MDRFNDLFKKITALFLTASEAGLALISLILVIYLLLGEDSGAFTLSVVNNLSSLIEALTPQAIVSVAIMFVAYAWMRRKN
jgi:hypothetical protein